MSVLFSSPIRAFETSRTPPSDPTAMAEAQKMGMKIVQPLWTMGAYDVVVLLEGPSATKPVD
jgi:uncharacterized protein with GYD domain